MPVKKVKCEKTGRMLAVTPKIPLEPMAGFIIMDVIDIKSELEKRMEKQKLIVSDKAKLGEQIRSEMQSKGVTSVYHEHPDQGVIVAIREDDAKQHGLAVGDKVVYLGIKDAAYVVVYNKKAYRAYRISSLICRYLTDKT